MNAFDLFRGFFGVPGGHRGRRDPFFETMTHDDEDDDEDDAEGGFYLDDGFQGDQREGPQGDGLRFGFSIGLDGMRIHEPPMFGHLVREMEEMFSQMGQWDAGTEAQHFGVPSTMAPPPGGRVDKGGGGGGGGGGSSGNPLRDFMLKSPDQYTQGGQPGPSRPEPPRHHDRPFSRFDDIWRRGPDGATGGHREDADLDSVVSSGGLDQILAPPVGQTEPSRPRVRSFFQSVSVSKVVKPDGTVEERRTVRDSQGHEETTVTRSGGPGVLEGPDQPPAPPLPGGHRTFSDLRDDGSLFSNFFGGFK